MLFHRARRAARKSLRALKSPTQRRQVRPQLEELESRALLSATTATGTDPTTTAATASTQTAQPSLTVVPLGATPSATSGYIYYTPSQIRQAYGITQATLPNGQAATGAGQTIAIIDAYNDPNIANDLAVFDSAYGLPAPPSFQVVQMGGVTQTNSLWASEVSLDVEWAHAVAPGANILLVETPTNSYSDLMAGVRYAASKPGVVAISMSWGGPEFNGETSMDSSLTTPAGHIGGSGLAGGITFVASAGDNGAWSGAQYPASSPNVLAVGGTSLYLTASNGYSSESAWTNGGGGYSHYEYEPSFQNSVQHSGWRTSPDVSYDANPNTGFIVYDSLGLQSGQSGWWLEGGTSAGAPQWAGIMALADQARAAHGLGSLGNGQQAIYSLSASDFHDVASGSNGYSAVTGYDMATGRGTPLVNRIVSDLSGTAGTNTQTSTKTTTHTSTTKGKTKPTLDTPVGLPGPTGGALTGPGGAASSTPPPAQQAAATSSASFTSAGKGSPAATFLATAPTAEVPLVPAANPVPFNPAVRPAEALGPVADALFSSVGVTCWDALDGWWSSPPVPRQTAEEDAAPEEPAPIVLAESSEEPPILDGGLDAGADGGPAEGEAVAEACPA